MTSAVLSLMYMGIQKGRTVFLTNQPTCDLPITWLVLPTNQPPQRIGWSSKSWLVTNGPPGHQQRSSPVGHQFTEDEEGQTFAERLSVNKGAPLTYANPETSA